MAMQDHRRVLRVRLERDHFLRLAVDTGEQKALKVGRRPVDDALFRRLAIGFRGEELEPEFLMNPRRDIRGAFGPAAFAFFPASHRLF